MTPATRRRHVKRFESWLQSHGACYLARGRYAKLTFEEAVEKMIKLRTKPGEWLTAVDDRCWLVTRLINAGVCGYSQHCFDAACGYSRIGYPSAIRKSNVFLRSLRLMTHGQIVVRPTKRKLKKGSKSR